MPEGQEVTVVAYRIASFNPQPETSQPHSVLDVPTVSLGSVIDPLLFDDDLLGEMLEGRP